MPRRVVIKRSAKLARDFSERKQAVVRYPFVKALDDPQQLPKVQKELSMENAFGISLKEYRQDEWLTEFDYKVGYNKNHLLDITFTQSGMGAYPDSEEKHKLIYLKTGELVKAAGTFHQNQFTKLAALVDKQLQQEIRSIIRDMSQDKQMSTEEKQSLKSSFAELKFKEENLDDFSVSDGGLTFLFDAGFPHAVQALEPNGRYFFSFSALKQYIDSNGPLGVLVTGK
ncbi:MAG TPA: hypothetical protein VGN86_11190 [Pyrinomonadaceae bacterium]|nr:hypothetical protein [Pyrinomonadaceae bacterium]